MYLPKWAVSENDVNTFKKVTVLIHDDSRSVEIVKSPTLLIDYGLITEGGIPRESTFFIDPWGNPYNFFLSDNKILVFSFGEDGKSITRGNDPDDINSWSELSPWREFYPPLNVGSNTKVITSITLVILITSLLVGYVIWRLGSGSGDSRP